MNLSVLGISGHKKVRELLSIVVSVSLLVVSFGLPYLNPPKANAALSSLYVRFDRQSAGAALSGVVCENTGTTGTENKVIVNFPTTFSLNGSGWTVDTTAANLPTGATGWPSIGGPTVVDTAASNAAIFTSGDLSTATLYCFHFTAGSSTVGTAGNDESGQVTTANVAAGGYIDNGVYATSIVSGTNGEQITVTASVSGTFTFSLSPTNAIYGQTLPFGVLSSSTVTTAPNQIQATVTTNANGGYIAWVKSANAALDSSQTGGSLTTVTGSKDLASNTGYGAFAYSSTGAIPSPFYTDGVGTAPTNGNGTLVGQLHSTQFDQIASETPGPISSHTFNVGVRAKLVGTEAPATDYTDTLTLVASGSF